MPQDDSPSQLLALRQRIDQLDRQVLDLLNQRAHVVIDIGKLKRDGSTPVYSPDREQQVLSNIRAANQGPLPDACVEAIWRELMSGSFALERSLRVGYLGPAGSFSHLAARRKFGASVEYQGLEDISGVFRGIAAGNIDLGLVPIENSSMGGIGETLDSFVDAGVRVYAEVLIGVHHNVLGQRAAESIKRLYSKPEVFSQCRQWLSTNMRQAERVGVASSSKAAELAAAEPDAAAIASSLAAELMGLRVLHPNIEDNPNNATRFFVIANFNSQTAPATGEDKTAIMFTTRHEAGSLARVLDVLRDHKLNLTHIDKRPSQRINWEYYFFLDFLGHCGDLNVAKALETARAHCQQLKVLGSFPRAKDVL